MPPHCQNQQMSERSQQEPQDFTSPATSPVQNMHQVYVQYAPRPSSNGLAVAALVLGVVGTALSLIPFLGLFLCWLPALLAIIFGFVGLGTARRSNGFRRTEALWGAILGFAPILITVVWYVIIGGLIGAANEAPTVGG
jgi:hypothetical protein